MEGCSHRFIDHKGSNADMTKATRLAVSGAMMLAMLLAGPGRAAADESAEVMIYASVAASLEVTGSSTMTFGTLARNAGSGTAELSPVKGLINCNMAPIGASQPEPAYLTVSAVPGQTFGVALSNVARVGRGPLEIEVASFTHDAGPTPVVGYAGVKQIRLGATMYVTRGAQSGVYSGNFDVIVTNN